jgi:DNA processing protein
MNIVDALVLRNLKGVGDGSITKLLEFSGDVGINSLEELAKIGAENLPLQKVPKALKEFLSLRDFEVARFHTKDELSAWDNQGVKVIYRHSESYPNQLLDLKDPPPFLFCKGNLCLLKNTRAIAVVGTRNNSPKGALIATKTVEAFQTRKFVIVSGLALGIDTIAHKAAIEFGAPTIAVLVDLSKISPASNKDLAEEILRNDGLLVAENKPGTPTIAALFVKRDRIQSGLSTAVFAIETSKNGGTMHAVRAAEIMRRPIFVPNAIAARYEDLSLDIIQGTQHMAKEGVARAYTSESYDSISKELEFISLALNRKYSRDIHGPR